MQTQFDSNYKNILYIFLKTHCSKFVSIYNTNEIHLTIQNSIVYYVVYKVARELSLDINGMNSQLYNSIEGCEKAIVVYRAIHEISKDITKGEGFFFYNLLYNKAFEVITSYFSFKDVWISELIENEIISELNDFDYELMIQNFKKVYRDIFENFDFSNDNLRYKNIIENYK